MNKPSKAKRPAILRPPARTLEDAHGFTKTRQAQPITKAAHKLSDFASACVSDPDFRHPQSEQLLTFMLLVRDALLDGPESGPINELWTLDDILRPIEDAVKAHAAANRMPGLNELNQRKADAKSWAQDWARACWEADAENTIRMSDMVKLVWSEMAANEYMECRPENTNSLRDWLRPIAPEYAKRAGRPKKA